MCLEDHTMLQYDSFEKRLLTFNNWPGPLDPLYMALAGFFFTGYKDVAICFNCGAEIFRWEESDDPITEHLKFSSQCTYINFMKSYIQTYRTILKLPEELQILKNKLDEREITIKINVEPVENNFISLFLKCIFFLLLFSVILEFYKEM